jgi:ribosome-associated heat shock protein Hsp15
MRLDRFLWFVRLAKTRAAAQDLIALGHIRLNGKRVDRPARGVAVGDLVVIPCPAGVLSAEILLLPHRRGPASEAHSCYRVLDGQAVNPIADAEQPAVEGSLLP